MAVFVLVHGAFVGGWCWRWVAPFLRAAGHEVHTPTLTGLGDRVHLASPSIDLDTHVDNVVNLLSYEDLKDVVLVGWSYGGMVVAGAADRVPDRVSQIVYLDSDVPRDGETSVPPSSHEYRRQLARQYGDGWRVPASATRAEKLLLDGLDERHRQWVTERLCPQPLKTWLQPISLSGAANHIPTTYVRCLHGYDPTDEDTARQDARIRSEPGWRYVELDATHAAPFTAPEMVAEVLMGVSGGWGSRVDSYTKARGHEEERWECGHGLAYWS